MAILGTVAGLALIFWILLEAFEAMVLPRRVTRPYRFNRFFYRHVWKAWRVASRLLPAGKPRDNFLAVFGPASILALMTSWVLALVFGFALVHLAVNTELHLPSPNESPTLFTYVYLSGVTFFTLGYGDVTAAGFGGRLLTVFEAGLGFGFLAVIIGYLPVLYGAFSQRETMISLLDARAGSPPNAGQLLLRQAAAGPLTGVDALLAEYERWAALVLESHLSFPTLSFYRCQHDNQSWLAALTVILDTCSLLLTVVPGSDRFQAQLTFAMSRHVVVDLAFAFSRPPWTAENQRFPSERLDAFAVAMRQHGIELRRDEMALAKLAELRAAYEPFVLALGQYFLLTVPTIWPEKNNPDNWQTSAWMRRTVGLGGLAVDPTDDHEG